MSSEEAPAGFRNRLSLFYAFLRYGVALVVVGVALGLRFLIAPAEEGLQFVTFFPAVALTAIAAGFGPGLLATALGAVLAAYFFLSPIGDATYSVWPLALFVIDGIIVCSAVEAMHRYFRGYKKVIGELEEAKSKAEQAQRAAERASGAKSQFLAQMSHELRTPLNAIIGFSDFARARPFGFLHPKYEEYFEDIHQSGSYLLELINELMDLATIEAGKVVLSEEDFDPGEVLTTCVRQIRPRAMEGDVAIHLAVPDLPILHADKRRMKQVVLNLLSNGVKYAQRGGAVTLSAAVLDDGLRISVADTGAGLNEEELALAVQPFGLVEGKGRKIDSVGLGLSVTKSLIELHGGVLQLASRIGEGTTATVILPRTRVAGWRA